MTAIRLCSICARGGSKGVRNKNLIEIAGIPLIGHSLRVARDSKLFSHIAVSSDSKEILEVAKNFGADLLIERPEELASDTAAKLPAIQHCFLSSEKMSGVRFTTICDLDSTSPLRIVSDIVGAVDLLESKKQGNVITGAKSRRSPYFNLVEVLPDGRVGLSKTPDHPIVRRQDAPRTFDMNASIYVWTRDSLLGSKTVLTDKTWLFEMPEDRSLDIDSIFDLELVEFLLMKRNRGME